MARRLASAPPRAPIVRLIPRLQSVIASFIFLARSRGYKAGPTAGELQEAVDEAARLAGDRVEDEPAALFYALARRPAAMDVAWRTFPRLMARNHAVILGFDLVAPDDDVEDLGVRICLDGLTFDDVRAFFAARLVRRAAP